MDDICSLKSSELTKLKYEFKMEIKWSQITMVLNFLNLTFDIELDDDDYDADGDDDDDYVFSDILNGMEYCGGEIHKVGAT